MPRLPKPWFREDRQSWFVTIDGHRHNLGVDEKQAKQKFHELMAARPSRLATPVQDNGLTVAEVFEKFLEWCKRHRSTATYEWYLKRIQSFINYLKNPAGIPVASLKPFHVVEWADKHSGWGANHRRGALIAIQRPFNWATKLGYIPASPLPFLEKPQATRRCQVITPDAWTAIRDHYQDGDPFRDLLEFAWETGCRPQEVKQIEARHVELESHRIVLPQQEAKGKKKVRIIYMTARAEAIIARLLALQRTELLFLNSQGRPWTAFSMNCRFCRLKKSLGVKYACYSIRHSFATRKLEEGLDHLTVAALMGHSDGTMLAKVYSHVGDRQDYLREKLNGSANLEMSKN